MQVAFAFWENNSIYDIIEKYICPSQIMWLDQEILGEKVVVSSRASSVGLHNSPCSIAW